VALNMNSGTRADVEVLEASYPILILERRSRPGLYGEGRFRAGANCLEVLRPHGVEKLVGNMFGMGQWIPNGGQAGGQPGATSELLLRRSNGVVSALSMNATNIELRAEDEFEFHCGTGGGFGDPLDRDEEAVGADLGRGWITAAEARAGYGVVTNSAGVVDTAATRRQRRSMLRRRLRRATLPIHSVSAEVVEETKDLPSFPLYPGVLGRGCLAFSERSGVPLAVAPAQWMDGCAVLEEPYRSGTGPELRKRSYLDPATGHALYVETVPAGEGRSFEMTPTRWCVAAEDGSGGKVSKEES
jgi:N-methylhydantoinase B